MDYFKKTEAYLFNYRSIKASVTNLEKEIMAIYQEEPLGISAVSYEEEPAGSNKVSSQVENEIIKKQARIEALEREVKRNKNIIERIDGAVDSLERIEQKLIKLRYLNVGRLTWRKIGHLLGYNEIHCQHRLRKKAVQQVSIGLFGEAAMLQFARERD